MSVIKGVLKKNPVAELYHIGRGLTFIPSTIKGR